MRLRIAYSTSACILNSSDFKHWIKNMKYVLAFFAITTLLLGCDKNNSPSATLIPETTNDTLVLVGKWIKESDGTVMIDPQTSGLAHWRGQLITLSDGSAHPSQRRRIHTINPSNATLTPNAQVMKMSSRVRRSCFASYLSDQPDLEALVVDPENDKVFYAVTEDATRTGVLSPRCQTQYEKTGSTDYPTVLLRIQRDDSGDTTITHVRPLRFATSFGVGNFPNDGIEGLAISPDMILFLGLEKDKRGHARIFQVALNDAFWQSSDFADVEDPKLYMPPHIEGNHPINGLTYVKGKLIAAARNDNEIWIIDVEGSAPAKRVKFDFAAMVEESGITTCGETEIMDNASIEGVAVINNTLWMINDPWKRNYLKNIKCEANAANYEAMAPLLFSTPLDEAWFD